MPRVGLAHLPSERSSPPQPLTLARTFEEIVRLAAHPGQKSHHFRMLSQRVDFTIVTLEFDLGQERMHLPMADPVQANRMQATT